MTTDNSTTTTTAPADDHGWFSRRKPIGCLVERCVWVHPTASDLDPEGDLDPDELDRLQERVIATRPKSWVRWHSFEDRASAEREIAEEFARLIGPADPPTSYRLDSEQHVFESLAGDTVLLHIAFRIVGPEHASDPWWEISGYRFVQYREIAAAFGLAPTFATLPDSSAWFTRIDALMELLRAAVGRNLYRGPAFAREIERILAGSEMSFDQAIEAARAISERGANVPSGGT